MNKTKIIIISLVLIAVSFYGGMKYNQSKIPARGAGVFAQNGGRGIRGFGTNGGTVNGNIISKDSTSITVQGRDGSSKIIFISDSTAVMKTVSGKLLDLSVGEQVTAMGTANSDGSITAESIQIRPATTTSAR